MPRLLFHITKELPAQPLGDGKAFGAQQQFYQKI